MSRRTVFIISISQIILYIAPLVTFPILIRAFDVSTYGIWVEASTIVNLAVSFGVAGISNALSMMIVNNKDNRDSIYVNGLYVFLMIGIGLGIFIWLVSPALNNITMRSPIGTTILQITSTIPLIVGMQILGAQIFRLCEQPLFGASLEIAMVIARLIAVVIAYFTRDLAFFAIIYSVLQAIVLTPFIIFAFWNIRLTWPSLQLIKEIIINGANLSLVSQSLWLIQYGDRFMISLLSVSAAVAVYSVSYQICVILVALGWPYLYALLPVLGNHWKADDIKGMYKSVRQSSRSMSILLIPSIVGLTVCGNSLLELLATKDFAQSSLLIFMITLGIGIDTLGGNILYIFFAQGRADITRNIYLRAALFNILANLVAIPLFSYNGAGLTTMLTFIYIFYSLWRKTEMPFRDLFDVSAIWRCLVASGLMGSWVVVTVRPTIIGLAIAIGGGAVIYGVGIIALKVISLDELLTIPRSIIKRIRQPKIA